MLGVESSCHGTGAGLDASGRLLGHAGASSMDEHARYGGRSVREITARAHVHSVRPVIQRANLIAHAGPEPAPLELSIAPSAPVEFAALHPVPAVPAQAA
ncbi:hypothetical protein ASD08_14530 [Streptomyces sp. Root369]|nr:hypothetical protein ASD08_14530 [Streptomyces sp. Root369]